MDEYRQKELWSGQQRAERNTPAGISIQKYEFAVGSAVHNVMEGLMNPEAASHMAQAMYDTSK